MGTCRLVFAQYCPEEVGLLFRNELRCEFHGSRKLDSPDRTEPMIHSAHLVLLSDSNDESRLACLLESLHEPDRIHCLE